MLILLLTMVGVKGAWAQKQFRDDWQIVKYVAGTDYDLQLADNFEHASYSIDAVAGDVGDVSTISIEDGKIKGVSGGGDIRIKVAESDPANDGDEEYYYVLTVAYATDKTWDFTTVTKNGDNWTDGGTRWSHDNAVTGNNAFVVPETAGLVFNTATGNLSVCEKAEDEFQYVGITGRGYSFTIPQLSAGDVVELKWKGNSAAGISYTATNVTDLSGRSVNSTFTIGTSGNGTYSFIVAADGDVTFTLQDDGCTDILSVRVYSGGYQALSTSIVSGSTPVLLTGSSQSVTFTDLTTLGTTACAKYEEVSSMGSLTGYSLTEAGVMSASSGYGRKTVRVNDYTADGENPYLIGYSSELSVTFGSAPQQAYPFTWNFENISGGAVKGRSNNVANSISTDYNTWTYLGYETYQLNTSGNTLYVPGARLVSNSRDLGKQGEVSTLNDAGDGCDEFNGLGFTGTIAFKLAQQGSEANDAPTSDWSRGSTDDGLLLYTFAYAADSDENNAYTAQNSTGSWVSAELAAGDGTIIFGSPGRREAPATGITLGYTDAKYAYRMDGGNTKYALLKPQRPFQNGDVITLHGYSTANVLKSGFSFYAGQYDNAYDALLTLNWADNSATDEQEIVYTVEQGDGLSGRSEVYLFRAEKNYTVFLTKVEITGDDASAPASYSYKRALNCVRSVTVTIPGLAADDYVYIKASAAPTSESLTASNLTAAVAADGLDAKSGVYKYKKTSAGNANLVFDDGTKVYRIGVTNITKTMTRVGSGDAWATESRNHAIDYTQTGIFTVNDITANTVTASQYALQRVTVKLNEQTDAMPANTGMVLKLPLVGADDSETTDNVTNFAKAKNYNSTNKTGEVPLFYPPHSTTILSSSAVGFNGTQGNLMKDNVTEKTFTSETETISTVDYTPFIFTKRYMKWTKVDNTLTPSTSFEDADVPVFIRLHVYSASELTTYDDDDEPISNTLGDNKAYMLIRSGNVPDALWDSGNSAKRYIGIEDVSDIYNWYDENEVNNGKEVNGPVYRISGQVVGNDESILAPGIYIRNGKKFVVK